YSFYQSLHAELSDFNVTDNLPELRLAFHAAPWMAIKGTYAFDYVLVGGDAYSYSHILSPSAVFTVWKGITAALEYTYRTNHFMNSDLFASNSDRTGFNNTVGVTCSVPVGSYGSVKVGYAYDSEKTREDFWDYTGNKVLAGLQVNLPYQLYLDLYGEYLTKNYGGLFPSTTDRREDIAKTASISFTKILSDTFSLSAGQLYRRNKSNSDLFDYNRAISSLFINARF
ncbi:MAG: hypothetical protein AB1442_13385, partial [Nitrospirota bacterium]